MPEPTRPILPFLLSLYACEAGLLGFLLGNRKLGANPWWRLEGPTAVATACSLLLLLAGGVVLVHSLRRSIREEAGHRLRWSFLLHLVTLAAMLLAGEGALRVLAVATPRSVSVLGRELVPYSWESVAAHHRALLDTKGGSRRFRVPDAELGWTVGGSRAVAERHCFSSVEGLRSPAAGISYAELAEGKRIIALVGDSYTFGLDVRYEDSWAARLQERLGDHFVVLNFGVDGYGIDQAYLRYRRDVIPWQPEAVVFGMIQHDFMRSLAAYPFLAFPTWELPFAKPRFELKDGAPVPRNVPLPPPDELFSRATIDDLPHLDLEPAYLPAEWRGTVLSYSLLARLLLTQFRPAPAAAGDEYATLNTAILRAFRERCFAEQSKPLLVYFPTNGAGDFPETRRGRAAEGRALRALSAARLDFLDLTPALRRLPAGRRFLPQSHYTPAGNAAAAERIHEALRELLPE